MRAILLLATFAVAACGPTAPAGSGTACGIAAVAGPAMVLSEFSTPSATLTVPPANFPARAVARFVAGPAAAAVLGRNGDSLEVGVEGGIPEHTQVGYGVLVTDPVGSVRGLLVFDGLPVLGAPRIGSVTVGPTRVPLLGISIDPSRVEDARCPFFPDSILR